MKKGNLNKKGQGLTIGTVILILLGLAVLVFLIIGFSQGWDVLFGKFDLAPSDLESVAQACQGYAVGNFRIDYCKFREVGKNTFVNCKTPMIQQNYPEAASDITCEGDAVSTFCAEIAEGKRSVTTVNEVSCEGDYTCQGLGGEWKAAPNNVVGVECSEGETDRTSLASDAPSGALIQKCCVAS